MLTLGSLGLGVNALGAELGEDGGDKGGEGCTGI